MATPPKKTNLRDLDADEKTSIADAIGDTVASGERIVVAKDFTAADGVPIPKESDLLDPESAQIWVEKEMVKATPRAFQELYHQMKKSPKAEMRLKAAMDILDRAGVQAKQAQQTFAPIFILSKDATVNLPWVKEQKSLPKEAKVIDSEPVVTYTTKDEVVPRKPPIDPRPTPVVPRKSND